MTVSVDRPAARRFRTGQSATDRLHWCGRDYRRSAGSLTEAEVARDEPAGVTPVFRFPPLGRHRQVYAHVTPAAERHRFDPPTPCTMSLYLKNGTDDYTSYTLLGGP